MMEDTLFSMPRSARVLAILCAWASAPFSCAFADTTADFYRGKTVDFYIGGDVGGNYDIVGRLLARHLERHIPGRPVIVVKNSGAAASIPLTNFLYNEAAKDGTVLGMIYNGIPAEPRLRVTDPDGRNLKFDVARFNWIGSPTQEAQTIVLWHDAQAKNLDDVKSRDTTIAATGASGDTYNVPLILNRLLGTQFRIIPGYGGISNMSLAMERGEVEGATFGLTYLITAKPEWLRDGVVRTILQFNAHRHPAIKDTPTILELLSSSEERQMLALYVARYRIARPIVMPPGVEAARVDAMRSAFDATMKDSDFLTEVKNSGIDIAPTGGNAIQASIDDINSIPQSTIDKLRALLRR